MHTASTTASEVSPVFKRSFDGLAAALAAAGGDDTPVLFGSSFGLGALRDGVAFSDMLDQRQWEAVYGELRAAAPHLAALPPLEDLHERAWAGGDGAVSIALAQVRYRRPGRRLGAALLRAQRDDAEIAVPGPLEAQLETGTAFFASALLPASYWGFERQPDRHAGLRTVFRLSPDFFLGNTERPDRIEIDFDDGAGFRSIDWNGTQPVEYDAAGERRIVLRAHGPDGERTAAFLFTVTEPEEATEGAASPVFGSDTSVRVNARIALEGRFYDGIAHVYYAWSNRDRRVKKPILLAEGFPGRNDPNMIYDYFNGYTGEGWNPNARLANELRDRGYDVVILIFQTRGAAIQANAYIYLRALQWLWEEMANPQGEICAMGGSMGGLIARYALAYAETHGHATTGVTRLVTFDSPHLGANLPLSVQFTARYFRERASDTNTLLDYPCAKQMLMHQIRGREGTEPIVKDEFIRFYAELEGLAKGGYPTKVKKYAVSNGAYEGAELYPAESHALTVWRTHWPAPQYRAILYCTANRILTQRYAHAECFISELGYTTISYLEPSPAGFFSRDACAGGTATFFAQTRDALNPPCANPGITLTRPRCCFVPAYSALGVKWDGNAHAFSPRAHAPGQTPFDGWYAPATNQPHCTVDEGIKTWVLNLLAKSLAPAEGVEAEA